MMSQVRKVNYVRAMIIIQSLVTAWFYFSPDLVPEVLRQAELANDRPLYEMLDLIVIYLVYFQAAFCLALWWPTWTISWLYLLTTGLIILLGSFSGPALFSAIDGLFGSLQALATGAMLGILFTGDLLKKRTIIGNGQ